MGRKAKKDRIIILIMAVPSSVYVSRWNITGPISSSVSYNYKHKQMIEVILNKQQIYELC